MIAIVNYGMGNLRSVQKALEHLGATAHITSDPADLHAADAVVLPGVGAFGAAMQRLNDAGLTPALRRAVEAGKPFLGICLGLQLLFENSSESPGVAGLGVLKGRVVGFAETPNFPLRIPHMGWSRLRLAQPDCPLWQGIPDGAYVYFVHSYYAVPEGDAGLPPPSLRFPRFARGTMQGVRFPLLAGGTLRRGFSLSLPTRFPLRTRTSRRGILHLSPLTATTGCVSPARSARATSLPCSSTPKRAATQACKSCATSSPASEPPHARP
jgi:glutamine amidotransferase